MADIIQTYKLNFTGDQINVLLTRINNLDIELNNYLLKNGGDMTGTINMNGQPISGLNDPTNDTQAARKGYVDAAATAANAYTDAAKAEANAYTDAAKVEVKAYADSKRIIKTATLDTAWSGSGPYTQAVSIAEILSTDTPHIMPVYSTTNSIAITQKEAWACVSKAETADGTITFTCFEEKPTTTIPIQIEVNR